MGEFDRIARLSARFGSLPPPALGIGDDAAVLPTVAGALAITVDASVEGVHFSRDLLSLDEAAARAMEAAVSDLAAMGAVVDYRRGGGSGVLCAWVIPPSVDDWAFEQLIEGTARATERIGARVLGGNLAAGRELSLTTTAIGRLDVPALTRGGARPGDTVYVTGVVGAAALGLRALGSHAGDEAAFAPFVRAWRAPRARLAEGEAIARFGTAAIDLSDGLVQDVGHLAAASGCAVVLDLDALPMYPDQREAAVQLGADPVELALSGGEDYEVCFTVRGTAPSAYVGVGWTAIGEVVAGTGVFVRDGRGVRPAVVRGWDHFGT